MPGMIFTGSDASWHSCVTRRTSPAGMLEMYGKPFIKGFTTNPTLMRKAGVGDYRAFARDVLSRVPGGTILFDVKCTQRLAPAIRTTLEASIAAGGTSVRDYVHSDGGAGCFQLSCAVYDRAGDPCTVCGTPIRAIRQAGRSTFYCATCQPMPRA